MFWSKGTVMASNAVHPIAKEVRQARASRFTDRMSACKGIFDRQTQVPPNFKAMPALTGLPPREAGNHPAGDENQSFLQLYMKAFAAARK